MACCKSCGKVLIGPVAGRPIREVKPTRPWRSERRRHLRTVHTEHPTAVAIWVSFNPAVAYPALLQACLKCGRLSSLSHLISFLLASQLSEKDHSAFVKAAGGTSLPDFCQKREVRVYQTQQARKMIIPLPDGEQQDKPE
jgi:hypothetical protein